MKYIQKYLSPVGELILVSEDGMLTEICFDNGEVPEEKNTSDENASVFKETIEWLDLYFSGQKPDFLPEMNMKGSEFQKSVWRHIAEIPYGQTTTYGEIAKSIAKERGISRMAAQAVGGAVGANPIPIIVPCHRVMGSGMKLTGYGGGIKKKEILLKIEGITGSC